MARKDPIYLDNASTTPLDPAVLEVMLPYFTERFYNPSAQYDTARQVKKALDEARAEIAHYLGCRPAELIFTAGGTEANNLAINGIMQQHGGKLIVSAIEHDSVLAPAAQYEHAIVSVMPDGRVAVDQLRQLIDNDTTLISVQYANNEIGTIQPIRELATIVADVRRARQAAGDERPLYLHVDACQASGYLDLHASRLGADMMTINASKIYGPKQIGALYVKGGIVLAPQILGGGQERGQRSGTENVPGIIGFAKALSLVQDRRHEESARLAQLQQLFLAELAARIPTAVVNGSSKARLVNNVHFTIPGQDNERLMILLDEQGIICAVGSACSASSEEPSHVLKAIGLSDEQARASLRFTMGNQTTEQDVKHTVDTLAKLVV